MTATLSQSQTETLADHLGVDADDLDLVETRETVAQLESAWEFTRDLSHLTRDQRRAVLTRSAEYTAAVIDGCEVRLYTEMRSASNGGPRCKAAVVDCGDSRIVSIY